MDGLVTDELVYPDPEKCKYFDFATFTHLKIPCCSTYIDAQLKRAPFRPKVRENDIYVSRRTPFPAYAARVFGLFEKGLVCLPT